MIEGASEKLTALVRDLADQGATKSEVQEAFASAIAAAYALSPQPPASSPVNSLELKQPSTPTDSQRAFREKFAGK
eukprot:CAMPEP_0119334792 /NCGR_PEP_ID=MMETSP1333-20130426/88090_1 /TAXON_ID=418940 /ORGANISM="Scyphosphaera apsteinii, Strain RCC1455" /LENGTH=75 /DNA_ID=CAMNT_0007345177 /DNA_START=255 /DNA_END=479 /DNA_ORIENTATION=-